MSIIKNPHLAKVKDEVYAQPDMIFNNIHEAMLVLGGDATIIMVNDAATTLLGYSRDELTEKPLGEVLAEDDIELFRIIKAMVSEGAVKHRDITCVSKKGEKIPVELNGSAMRNGEGKLVGILAIMRDMRRIKKLLHDLEESRNSLEVKVRERTADLEEAKNDIESAYKELQQAQSQLLQSEKMASVGQLAAGVAHEINNPIGFIYSNLSSLSGYVKDLKEMVGHYETVLEAAQAGQGEEAVKRAGAVQSFKEEIDLAFLLEDLSDVVDESMDGASRVKKIVADLKEFSHVDEAELKPADINRGLESTLNIVKNEIRSTIEVEKRFGEIPLVECYPQQLNQVFLNLLVNASQTIEGKGKIGIQTSAGNGSVVIRISDTGCGIPQEKIKRIFEPFFTTKPVGVGTGLGLSMSYGIIKNHGGTLNVESVVGKGTTFIIELPATDKKEI